jgi:integrase
MNTCYTPKLDDQDWAPIREFVATSVARCFEKTAYSTADLFQTSSRLIAWSQSARSMPLSEEIFAPSVIEDFVCHGLPTYSPASRGNRRSILLRMSEAILGERAGRVRLEALPSSVPSRPYSGTEVSSLRTWIDSQTPNRRPRALALVGLGLGAGLSTGEITSTRCGDITVKGDEVLVAVSGARFRTVRVAVEWRTAILEAGADGSADDWIFCPDRLAGGKNMVTNFLAKDTSGGIRPNAQKMRATWIVRQLNEGAPAVQLMRDAGVRSMTALSRFVPYVDAA